MFYRTIMFGSSYSTFETVFLLIMLLLIPVIIYILAKNPVKEKNMHRTFLIFIICLCCVFIFLGLMTHRPIGLTEKPVIYLYPEKAENISVKLKYNGKLTCTYPKYNNGWDVTAFPDGNLTDLNDNGKYQYLYWEGLTHYEDWDMSQGFVVPGDDTIGFLQGILPKLGLTNSEANEFITYWLPYMQSNKYNLIHFAGADEYEKLAALDITPRPDNFIRVFMIFKSLNNFEKVPEQNIKPVQPRTGFTAVEWGGTELK